VLLLDINEPLLVENQFCCPSKTLEDKNGHIGNLSYFYYFQSKNLILTAIGENHDAFRTQSFRSFDTKDLK
jgi:hypothetical protein